MPLMTKALNCAFGLLVRRDHGAVELYDKLRQKGFCCTQAQQAVITCQQQNLQNDSRFVENYSLYRMRKGYGPLKIIQELKTKGIDLELLHPELGHEEEVWYQQALEVWRKKSKAESALTFKTLQKLQQFLLYRGFTKDMIAKVVKATRQESLNKNNLTE